MEASQQLSLIAAGVFFLTALLTGVWKYLQIAASADAAAHPYVDVAHRAALLYSFAAMLLLEFTKVSELPPGVELLAVAAPLLYFALAILSYIVHGVLRDTDNQLRKPHKLGPTTMPGSMMRFFMWSLIVAEIGGFVVLFYGVVVAVL